MANWADFPSVVAGENGVLLAHWLASSPGEGFVYGIELARSVDDGRSWKRLGSPHGKQRASEYGFVTILPEGEGFRVFWLDGRELGRGGTGKMSLRSCLVGEGIGEQVVLDGDVCTCCQTAATPTSLGPTVVYRDHEEGELRDISIVQRTSEGWSAPRTVHRDSWEIPGCPVNGPAIVSHEGLLAVAWFTRAERTARVRVAFSRDHGGEFTEAFTIDSADPLGRVAVIGAEDGAIVGWLGSDGDQAVFRLCSVSADGEMGPTIDVGRTELSRASGFPRMVASGDEIVLAWRETGEETQLRTAVLSLSSLSQMNR
jgi:hypothetical protein